MKCNHNQIIRQKEYVGMDSYAYCIRCKKCNKLLVSEWSEKEAEEAYKKLKK